jgi:hypothetical protein
MLNPQLLHKTRGEHARRKRPSKDRSELSIETTNPHILEPEIGRQNSICRWLARRRLDFDGAIPSFEKVDFGLRHENANAASSWTGACIARALGLERRKFDDLEASYDGFEGDAMEVKYQDLAW